MGQLITGSFGATSSRFAGMAVENDLAAGVGASYAIVKYKGGKWSTTFRGKQDFVMRPDGDGPASSIEVVILRASKVKSKLYYEGYEDGANKPPICFSSNGVSPDPRAQTKQANACAICPKNVSGSRIDENGQARGKACRDNKRVALVPLGDLHNESLGGPMLLRIPAASLNDFATYGNALTAEGFQYFAVATKISFDIEQSYPKMVFQGTRPLTDAEADVVIAHLNNKDQLDRIIAEDTGDFAPAPAGVALLQQPGAPSAKFANVQTEEVAEAEEKPAPKVTKAKVTPKAKVVEAPAEEEPPFATEEGPTGLDDLDAELEAML